MRFIFLLVFAAALLCQTARARCAAPLYLLPNGPEQTRDEAFGAFTRASFSAGLSRSLYSSDADLAWDQYYAATITLYRGKSDERFLYFGRAALSADESNPIHFSPNSVFYDNLLLFSRPIPGGRLGIGYFQRCKHHVDTTGRVWLYNGPYVDTRFRTGTSGDGYYLGAFLLPLLYSEDLRVERQPRLIFGMEAGAEKKGWRVSLSPGLVITGSSGGERYLVFRDLRRDAQERPEWDIDLEMGRSWRVHGTDLSAYLEYTDTEDAGVSMRVERTRLFALGFRIGIQ